ncbi:MAG: SufD family Fe-S cluster assembly protein [Alphaproteobacteria bacterium]|nr:SufD family Fe-S cluster assembly protein [Alphaproteobacteria bacterium]
MSYMWNEFNIKTFPAETIVFRDGQYCPELSTLENKPIDKKFDLPVHIIFVGEINDNNTLNIELGADEQEVILTAKILNKKPAFLNIFIKNAGKNSKITGNIFIENLSELTYKCDTYHLSKNTDIFIKNKVWAGKNSKSVLSGTAQINKNCENCGSDLSFTAMCEQGAKIDFMPAQKISSIPKQADHSASLYEPTDAQILYLRQAGLGILEIKDVTKETFLNE